MMSDRDWAIRMKDLLDLNLEPVGVRIYHQDEEIPETVRALETESGLKSYCQGLCLAARGSSFYGGSRKLGCPLGTSTLGLEDQPDPLLEGAVSEKYGVGLYDTEAASRASVDAATKFKAGANQSVLIAPLADFPATPQVIIMEALPETVMWLLYAANHASGGSQALPQSGGVAGGCSDVTTIPMFEGMMNITFMGLGCRMKSGLPPQHLLAGFPAGKMEEIVGALDKMAKPMAKLNQVPRLGDQ